MVAKEDKNYHWHIKLATTMTIPFAILHLIQVRIPFSILICLFFSLLVCLFSINFNFSNLALGTRLLSHSAFHLPVCAQPVIILEHSTIFNTLWDKRL